MRSLRAGRDWTSRLLLALVAALAAGAAVLGVSMGADGAGPARAAARTETASGSITGPTLPTLPGPLRAPGGPYLEDRTGRVVLLHGVNVVEKRWPYEVYPDPTRPWNFGVRDARRIASLGFDVVRLGILWAGLEPGSTRSNRPSICRIGRPGDPGQLRRAVLGRYLAHLRRTVDLLARFHVYTILDMHQDLYSSVLGGDGAPAWAVCTDGVAPRRPPGRWSRVYGTAALHIAFRHFWTNDVVGNLQGQFDLVWSLVARAFRHDPWVIGFDPLNEPFVTPTAARTGTVATLVCLYAGRSDARGVRCAPGVPRTGLLARLRRADPRALLFVEPAIGGSHGAATLGPMPFGHLVFNVHVYCSQRSPVTGNPVDLAGCAAQERHTLLRRLAQRAAMRSRAQPGGPPMVVTELGATSDAASLRIETSELDGWSLGWMYWAWKYYHDPTGSSQEALVRGTGRLRSTAGVLAEVYPEAIAGRPLALSFDASTGVFLLRYRTLHRVVTPTLIVVPAALRYRRGYCARVTGGLVVSPADHALLEVASGHPRRSREVTVRVAPGRCAPRAGRWRGRLRPVDGRGRSSVVRARDS